MKSREADILQAYEHDIPFDYWVQCIKARVFDNNTLLKCSQALHEISEALGNDIDELILRYNNERPIYHNRRKRRELERKAERNKKKRLKMNNN